MSGRRDVDDEDCKETRKGEKRERENAVSDGGAMANSVRFFASRIYTYMYITNCTYSSARYFRTIVGFYYEALSWGIEVFLFMLFWRKYSLS